MNRVARPIVPGNVSKASFGVAFERSEVLQPLLMARRARLDRHERARKRLGYSPTMGTEDEAKAEARDEEARAGCGQRSKSCRGGACGRHLLPRSSLLACRQTTESGSYRLPNCHHYQISSRLYPFCGRFPLSRPSQPPPNSLLDSTTPSSDLEYPWTTCTCGIDSSAIDLAKEKKPKSSLRQEESVDAHVESRVESPVLLSRIRLDPVGEQLTPDPVAIR